MTAPSPSAEPSTTAPAAPSVAWADWRAVVDGLSEAIIAVDERNAVLYLNAAAEQLLGWTPADLVGEQLTAVIPDRYQDRHVEAFAKFVHTGDGHLVGRPMRVPALRRDGTETPVELLINAIEVLGRRVLVGLLRDVTDRVEIEGPGDLADRLVASLAESATLDDAWPRVLHA